MARIRPFKAVRPHRDKAHLVGSRSYLSYTDDELTNKLLGNPFSFLHVIQPELLRSVRQTKSRSERYLMVKEGYQHFLATGVLEKEKDDAYYVYRQTKGNESYAGIVAAIAVEDYLTGHVKVHEETLTKRENIFKEYLEVTGFNAEPVLLSYDDNDAINTLVDRIVVARPEFEFYTTDLVKHELWVIDRPADQELVTNQMAMVPDVYIADGHHRCASSALVATAHKNENDGLHQYFMCMLLPSSQLRIADFNRLVTDLHGHTPAEFLEKISEHFEVAKAADLFKPNRLRQFSLYLDNQWYELTVKPGNVGDDPVNRLDARVLTNLIFKPILEIHDLKTDYRVDFLDGTHGMRGLQKAVDSGKYAAAFGLFPVTFEQLKEVSDCGEIMPPKSTYIEPKLRSGLTIYELFEGE